jgi:diguanylate cyclase (GGDEF)-like protein/PAS domain S-box-containing protein
MSNRNVFPSYSSFETGIKEVDNRNISLLARFNLTTSCLTMQHSDTEIKQQLKDVIYYTASHFELEKAFWFASFPNIYTLPHLKSYAQFEEGIHRLAFNSTDLEKQQWLDELFILLTTWPLLHILKCDKRMIWIKEAMLSGMTFELAEQYSLNKIKNTEWFILNDLLNAHSRIAINSKRFIKDLDNCNNKIRSLTTDKRNIEAMLNYAKIGYWTLTPNEYKPVCSEQVRTLLGLSTTTPIELAVLSKITGADTYKRVLKEIKQCLKYGIQIHIEFPITRLNDGKVRWIECRGKAEYNQQGKIECISGFIQDITHLKLTTEQLSKLTYHDFLTALPNRRSLINTLNHLLSVKDVNVFYDAILFIDIDNFKSINESVGYAYGDELLVQATNRLLLCIKKTATLSRIGGDEFVAIISTQHQSYEKATNEIDKIATRSLQILSAPYSIEGHLFNSSASIGIVLFNDNSLSSDELIKRADIAMYQAKNAGKNTALYYEPRMYETLSERVWLEQELRKAIQTEQFVLYYQPQVGPNEQVIGAEALIRWHHPDKGIINPAEFIPLAELIGLIIPIGDWVLDAACQQLNLWQKYSHSKHLTLSVNVSYKQIHEDEFITKLTALLKKYNIPAGRLKIELTETMLVDDIMLTISRMKLLNDKGVQFALDDFGTGYSSLQYLKRLPLEQLKIDRSFVMDIENDPNDRSIVKTIISMSDALGISVIAEGVETIAQKTYLQKHGCRSFQGYLFSKPIPIQQFDSYLATSML